MQRDDAEPWRVRILPNISGFEVDSDLAIDQIKAIDNRRLYGRNRKQFIKKIAPADEGIMRKVEDSLRRVCGLL